MPHVNKKAVGIFLFTRIAEVGEGDEYLGFEFSLLKKQQQKPT